MLDLLLDIDGPLARKNELVLINLYRSYFNLAVKDDILQRITNIREFEALPETIAFKHTMGCAKYEFLMRLIVFDPRHIAAAMVEDNACAGVHTLVKYTHALGYCTARRGMNATWTDDVKKATYAWLEMHTFPCYDRVTFCEGPEGKLHWIAACIHQSPGEIMLVDDLSSELVHHFSSLTTQEQDALADHFVLGAYGVDKWSGDTPFHIIPLPSWRHTDHFIQQLKGI